MKRILAVALSLSVVFCLSACKSNENSSDLNSDVAQSTATESQTSDSAETSKPVETSKPSETSKPLETSKPSETSKPIETSKPPETSKPSETSSTSETSKPIETSKPTVSSHSHSYAKATCTEPAKCSCGETNGNALGHSYKDGKCTLCGQNDPNALRNITEGEWVGYTEDEGWLHTVTFYFTNENNQGSCGYMRGFIPDDSDDISDCSPFEYNGKTYYFQNGVGDGDAITYSEADKKVVVKDDYGTSVTLERISNDVLKVTEVSGNLLYEDTVVLKVGTEFNYRPVIEEE